VKRKVRRAAGDFLRRVGLKPSSLADSSKGGADWPKYNLDDEANSRPAAVKVASYTMGSYLRLITLWEQVRYVDLLGLEGALVECGVWRGGSTAMMAMAHRSMGEPRRPIHLFDSFEGLPEPQAEHDGDMILEYVGDEQRLGGELKSIGRCVAEIDLAKKAMHEVAEYPESLTHYHVGWFEATVAPAAAEIGPIAVLRLDGDFYRSTQICLEHLYPLVVPGGFVVIDDYGHWEGCKKALWEYFDAHFDQPPYLHLIDRCGRYFIKPSA